MLLIRDVHLDILNIRLIVLKTGLQTSDLILQVLHLQRKLASQRLDLVDIRHNRLKLIQRVEFLLHGIFLVS